MADQLRTERALSCPSGAADDPEARVFAVVGGTAEAPRVSYLEQPVPVTPELIEQLDGVSPGEVLRVVSPCSERGCRHFSGGRCGIAKQVVALSPVAPELPPCAIRATCRWFAEHRAAACMRCPQVVTLAPARGADESVRRRLPVVGS